MYAVINGFAELLAASPEPVLEFNRVGALRPSTPSEVPAVIVSLSIDDHRTTGLGSIARGGDMPGTAATSDIRGTIYRGLMNVEVWANSLNEVSSTSRKLQDRLGEPLRMRQFGFLKLQAAGLAATEHTQHKPAVGSPFAVWKQPLSYRFAFTAERPIEPSESGQIRDIHVEIGGSVEDSLSVPPAIP